TLRNSLMYVTPSTSLHVGTANSLTSYISTVLLNVSNGTSDGSASPFQQPAMTRSIAAIKSIRVVKFTFTPLFILLEACTSEDDVDTLKVMVFIEQTVNLFPLSTSVIRSSAEISSLNGTFVSHDSIAFGCTRSYASSLARPLSIIVSMTRCEYTRPNVLSILFFILSSNTVRFLTRFVNLFNI